VAQLPNVADDKLVEQVKHDFLSLETPYPVAHYKEYVEVATSEV